MVLVLFSVYHAIYLDTCTVDTLNEKIAALFMIETYQIIESIMAGPSGINILITDDVSSISNDSCMCPPRSPSLRPTLFANSHTREAVFWSQCCHAKTKTFHRKFQACQWPYIRINALCFEVALYFPRFTLYMPFTFQNFLRFSILKSQGNCQKLLKACCHTDGHHRIPP